MNKDRQFVTVGFKKEKKFWEEVSLEKWRRLNPEKKDILHLREGGVAYVKEVKKLKKEKEK